MAYIVVKDKAGNVVARAGRGNGPKIKEFGSSISVNPMTGIGESIGQVSLGLSLSRLHEDRRHLIRLVYLVLGTSLFVNMLGSLLAIKYKIIRPLTSLVSAIERIGKGDLSHRVSIKRNDEIGRLAALFNKMAEDLSKTLVSRTYFDNIIESMIDTLIVTHPDGTISMVNQATLDLLGYGEGELVGTPVAAITEKKGSDEGIYSGEIMYITKSDRKIDMLISRSMIFGEDGETQSIVYVGRDITGRKQSEERLSEQAKELESAYIQLETVNQSLQERIEELNLFVYTISHDLKNPVVSLQGFSSLLVREHWDQLDESGRLYMNRIEKNSEQLGVLLDNLLELSKIVRLKGSCEPVDVSDVVSNVADEILPRLKDKGTKLIISDDMPVILGDRERIGLIFFNLIDNARKFMGADNKEPIIEVGCNEKDGYYVFHVKDNGIGIDERYHEKIFQLFQRLNDIKSEGTGAGLAITKEIVKDMGGHIWVDSAVGSGTTMYFTIPKPAGNSDEEERGETHRYTFG